MGYSKRIAAVLICVAIVTSMYAAVFAQTVNPTASTVIVNGSATAFEAYLIDGNNYFKLRDLAYAINGSNKQFSVDWDETANAITLASGQQYVVVGGEMEQGDGTAKTAEPTTSKVFLDGTELNLTAYLINGNNFFRLRDLMQALDIGVTWDDATSTIGIDTSVGYDEPEQAPAQGQGPGQAPDSSSESDPLTAPAPGSSPIPDPAVVPDPIENSINPSLEYYDTFPIVPTYNNVDPDAERVEQLIESGRAFYFYRNTARKIHDYRELLLNSGFDASLIVVTDSITMTKMELYNKGDIYVAIELGRLNMVVRIVEHNLDDTASADDLRMFNRLFNL